MIDRHHLFSNHPQAVDDLQITIHLLCAASNLSETLKSSLSTIEGIEAELGEMDG